MRSFLILLIGLFSCGHNSAQTTIAVADTSIKVSELMNVQPYAVRIAKNPMNNSLYYTTWGGDIYKIIQNGSSNYDTLVCSEVKHHINYLQGMLFHDSLLYLLGNWKTANSGYGLLMRGKWQGNDTWKWDTLMRTAFYPSSATLFDHAFSSLCLSANGDSIYVGSGSRTDHGEVQSTGGQFPGQREASLTSIIFRFPINSPVMIHLPNDSSLVLNSGYVYARGVRNSFDLALAPNNDLLGTENSGDRDDSEELNWLREGHHYGFPWQMGGNNTGQQFLNYNPVNDLLINHNSLAWQNNYFTNDPAYPQIPGNITVMQGIANYGPDADKFRDPINGKVRDASDENSFITSFTSHRSPLGLVFDKQGKLAAPYSFSGFMLNYTTGTMDSSGNVGLDMGPFVDLGQDLVQLALFKDSITNSYSMNCYKVAWNFNHPVDAWLENNILYVIETHGEGDPVLPKLYKIVFPINTSNNGFQFLPSDTSICAGTSVLLSPKLKGKYNYKWSTGSIKSEITVSPATTKDYYVKISNGIISFTDTIHISVIPKPSIPTLIKGLVSVCRNENKTYSIRKVAGADFYRWTPAPSTSINGSSSDFITTDTSITVSFSNGFTGDTLKVCAMNCAGQSSVRKLFINRRTTVPGIPPIIQGQANNLCALSSASYLTKSNAAASYFTWRCDNSGILLNGQTGPINVIDTFIQTSFPTLWNVTKLYVSAVNGCGQSAERSLRISTAPSTPDLIEGSLDVCTSSSLVPYSTNSVAGSSSYIWTVNNGAVVTSGQGTNSITVNFGLISGATKLTVKSQNSCGNSLGLSTNINVINCAKLENENSTIINVYPNPFSNIIYLDKKDQQIFKIILMGITGQKIIEQSWTPEIDLSFLDEGIYFLELWNKNGIVQRNKLEKIYSDK